MKTMKDYYELYLKCHVLLVANVFEKFVNSSLQNHRLCLSHYLSGQALSWDAMLDTTKVEIQLISDTDMYSFFEKGMRGGVSYVSKRYSKANKNI